LKRGLKFYTARIVLLIVAMGSAATLFSASDTVTVRRELMKSIRFVPNKVYEEECTSCHVGYLPGFLPARSWTKIMAELEDHFGENASVDAPVAEEIKKYLIANAADAPKASVRSKRIAKLISADDHPIRITETPFWTRKHFSIKGFVWKREKVGSKARCDTCHHDANKGLFSEYDVHVPK